MLGSPGGGTGSPEGGVTGGERKPAGDWPAQEVALGVERGDRPQPEEHPRLRKDLTCKKVRRQRRPDQPPEARRGSVPGLSIKGAGWPEQAASERKARPQAELQEARPGKKCKKPVP